MKLDKLFATLSVFIFLIGIAAAMALLNNKNESETLSTEEQYKLAVMIIVLTIGLIGSITAVVKTDKNRFQTQRSRLLFGFV